MRPTYIDKLVMRHFVVFVPRYISPNSITAFRFVSVPFVAWLLAAGYFKIGFVLFAISAFSDVLDGAVARMRGEVTPLGKLFDPIADKLLIVFTSFILISEFLSMMLFFAILIVESLIITSALVGKYLYHLDIKANLFGKIKMALQSAGVLSLLIYAAFWKNGILLTLSFWFLVSGIILAVISLLYNRNNI